MEKVILVCVCLCVCVFTGSHGHEEEKTVVELVHFILGSSHCSCTLGLKSFGKEQRLEFEAKKILTHYVDEYKCIAYTEKHFVCMCVCVWVFVWVDG